MSSGDPILAARRIAGGLLIPKFARDLLFSPPARGEGLNIWFFRIARILHTYCNPKSIAQLLETVTAGQPVKPGEIERAVARSKMVPWEPGLPFKTTRGAHKPWPKVNFELREAIVSAGGGLADLWEMSPTRLHDNARRTEEIIDAIFPGNPFLCIANSAWDFRTQTRERLRGKLARFGLIVPSAMIAATGMTQDGKVSAHTLAATGPRQFLVIEFDLKEKDTSGRDTPHAEFIRQAAGRGQTISDVSAALLLHLAERAPLVLAVHSGGKSIHGWFSAAGRSEELLQAFMNYAVSLGADSALWTRSQFARMPDGTRDNGRRQTVYFFNPEVIR